MGSPLLSTTVVFMFIKSLSVTQIQSKTCLRIDGVR
ncbi:Uncharacterised protein [Lysinibacillus sphaericus]|nr:Uncharacterised protein [Lysinibacillus sphaericus]